MSLGDGAASSRTHRGTADETWSRGIDAAGRKPRSDGLDPAVAFAPDGAAHLLADGESLMAFKSADGGFTWSTGAVVPGRAWDRPWIAGGLGGGASERRLYVTGKMPVTVFGHRAQDIVGFSISSDGGTSFPPPRLFLPDPEKELVNVVNDLVVLPDGRILLTLQLFPPAALAETPLRGYYATLSSLDLGKSFAPPRRGPSFRTFGHANEGKSLFGLAGSRAAADASGGPRAGRFYLTWVDAHRRLLSRDGGELFRRGNDLVARRSPGSGRRRDRRERPDRGRRRPWNGWRRLVRPARRSERRLLSTLLRLLRPTAARPSRRKRPSTRRRRARSSDRRTPPIRSPRSTASRTAATRWGSWGCPTAAFRSPGSDRARVRCSSGRRGSRCE